MEKQISSAIVKGWFHKLESHLECDVVIVGAGPSGLICAAKLASRGIKTAVFERKLAPGGGMWGGAMLFNQIVIQAEALPILDEFQIKYQDAGDGLYLADAVESTAALIYAAANSGAAVFTGITVEDVIVSANRVNGVVINWTPVSINKMHVDPLCITARIVLDGTGHPCEVVSILTSKNHIELDVPSRTVVYERSMNAVEGEKAAVEFTGQVYPGL
ncbi:MAG: sulfide-dependent adenosine diphosphate thiazole synthase, partial [Candidatus Cloacimonadaceae bacterium]|nr:sulfide-dependent adenosine diphosphate thiazole synthase [Candidatus Cloacimonadaceae bacterium]